MNVKPELNGGGDFIEDLGLIVGIEQGCSISAAEAYEATHKIMEGATDTSVYLIAEDPTLRQKGSVVNLHKVVAVGDRQATLAIVKPASIIETRTPQRKFFRKVMGVSRTRVEGDPLLCARIGEDSYLPLARFALESDIEACSYVQLGSEMTDETVAMTALDERTSRQRVVEAIRTLYAEYGYNKSSEGVPKGQRQIKDPSAGATLQKLVDQQVAAHAEQLNESQEAMLVRRCFEKAKQSTPRKLHVVAEDGSEYLQQVNAQPILTDGRIDNARFTELTLARENGDQSIRLYAVTRGDIAFPVATIIRETSKVIFDNVPTNDSQSHVELIGQILDAVRGKPLFNVPVVPITKLGEKETTDEMRQKWEEIRQRPRGRFGELPLEHGEYYYDPKSYYHTVLATFLYKRGLLRPEEGAIKDVYRAGMTEWGVHNTRDELNEFLIDPDAYDGRELPHFLDQSPMWLALSRLALQRKAQQQLFDKLGVAAKMKEQIGDTTIAEERFLAQVQGLLSGYSSTSYAATIDSVNTGTNEAAIDVQARLHRDGTRYAIQFFAKSHALKTQAFPAQPYRAISFDALGSIAGAITDTQEEALLTIHRFSNTLQKLASDQNSSSSDQLIVQKTPKRPARGQVRA